MFSQFKLWLKSKPRAASGTGTKCARRRSCQTHHLAVERLEERALLAVASLVQTINTFQFSPPSPDPAGIVYLPDSNTLLIADSEVNEMPIFAGDNLFESSLSGSLVNSFSATSFSDEPTGVTLNPVNGHLFFSDDTGVKRIFELDPASDGLYGTADDIVTSFKTGDFGSSDPEGVAYDFLRGRLFMADGVNDRVYEVAPGGNGVFDGVAPAGDDQVTSFDVLSFGLSDPEGMAFNGDNGHLYVVGNPADTVFEITTEGALVQLIDISAANAKKPAGLAYAPSSTNPSVMGLYIADRGTDNDRDPNENDGRVYEMSFDPSDPGPVTSCSESTHDAYINQEHPDENKGDDNDLKVKPDSGKERRILAEFDVTTIPPNSSVIDATLMLYEDNHKDNQTVFVHRVTGSWVESQVTWEEGNASNSWNTPGGDFDTTPIASFAPDTDGEYREIDVTGVARDWVNGTSTNHGLLLRSTGANGEVKFKSREEGNSDKRPQLCVTYEVSTSGNQAPTVNAGPDQTIVFPGSAILDAAVIDDGDPDPPGAIATTWTQVSGPGTVTFADPSAIDTAASFSEIGTYVLRLTADDGELLASDDVRITASPSTVTQCSESTHDAYINQDQPDENKGDDNDLKVKPDSGKERRILAEFDVTFIPPNSEVTDATLMLYEDNHKDNQTIYVHRVTGSWVESQVTWEESGASISWITEGGDYDPTVIASFAPDTDGEYREIDVTDVTQDWVNGTSANYGLLLRSTGANGEVKFKSREEGNSDKHPLLCVTYQVGPPGNQSPTVNAGPNQTISFPDSALLDSTVTDDGQPDPPGTIATTWTQLSGPGTVTFVDPSAMDTTASFSAVGTYVLRLTANDGELAASDDIAITVVDSPTPFLHFSYSGFATFPGGLNVDNEDIVSFDGTNYSMVLDGSDIGLSAIAIDAIEFIDADEILMSFTSGISLPGISGTVDDSDIVKFTATQLGDTTAGTFELFFDGSDVGLGTSTEDIDAIELLDDGRVLISTTGDFSVSQLTGQGEDIIALTPTSLGDTTAGTWSLYFDGDDVGLTGVGVDGASVSGDGAIYLTAANSFTVPGLSGKDEDVFVFNPSSLGEDTAGAYDSTLLFDGSLHGAGADLKAIDVTISPITTPPPIEFRVLADVPYDAEEYGELEADLANVASTDEFFVHLGDITSDIGSCGESVYSSVSSSLQTSSVPVFIVPGDNEWNDCSDPDQAWSYWDTHLMRLEENWSHSFNVLRQSVREENFAFVDSGVLFIGINLVGGSVHDSSEWSQRMTDDANWVVENFNNYGSQVTSAVVFGHSFADPSGGDRQQFGQDFVTAAQNFSKPILYMMGDDHSWVLDQPYDDAPNVTRVTVDQGVPSVRVTVTHNPVNPFAFDQSPLVVQSDVLPKTDAEPIGGSQLAPIVEEAVLQLSHSSPDVASMLAGLNFEVVDLPGNLLGRTYGITIQIDANAAGFGWFIDPTADDDSEFVYDSATNLFVAPDGSVASQRVDLLTAVMHELGHVLGLEHTDADGLMNPELPLGTRRLPSESSAGETSDIATADILREADTARYDVSGDGNVTALDALQVINYLSAMSTGSFDTDRIAQLDVNQDDYISALDALLVINYLNRASVPQGEGIAPAMGEPVNQPKPAAAGIRHLNSLQNNQRAGFQQPIAQQTITQFDPAAVRSLAIQELMDEVPIDVYVDNAFAAEVGYRTPGFTWFKKT